MPGANFLMTGDYEPTIGTNRFTNGKRPGINSNRTITFK
jgi:hypothetical protein